MENKSHAIAAGTFVLALLAVVVALAVWLARDTRALRFYELSSADTVTGLQPEASVRFKGVNVGKVTAIGFDPVKSGHVLIRIAVDEHAPITLSTWHCVFCTFASDILTWYVGSETVPPAVCAMTTIGSAAGIRGSGGSTP